MVSFFRWPAARITVMLVLLFMLSACDTGGNETEGKDAAVTVEKSVVPTQPGPVTGSEALPPGHPSFEGMQAMAPSADGSTAALPAGHPQMPAATPGAELDADAPTHPVSTSGKELAINISDSVKGKWSTVTLELAEADGNANEYQIGIGEETLLPTGDLTVRVEVFVPSYKSDFETITSASDALDNPAVKIALIENQKVVAKGWVFQNLPEFNSFSSDRLKVKLLSVAETAKATAP